MTQGPQTTIASRQIYHDLKTWPAFYDAVATDRKTFELRFDDRGYMAGDILNLLEFVPEDDFFTGRRLSKRVSFILRDPKFGVRDGFVCMGLQDV